VCVHGNPTADKAVEELHARSKGTQLQYRQREAERGRESVVQTSVLGQRARMVAEHAALGRVNTSERTSLR
jgi:hypothetical protein